jgi:hypothetical protein
MGEELNAAELTEHGLRGDRVYALVDSSNGKVASAKNPRKWPQLFDFRAAFVETPRVGEPLPPVRITLPDGTEVSSEQSDINDVLSRALNRETRLEVTDHGYPEKPESSARDPWAPRAEEYWPDMEGLDYRDTVTDFDLPEGTFFRRCRCPCPDHGNARPAPRAVSRRAVRGAAIPAERGRGSHQRREGLRRECLD